MNTRSKLAAYAVALTVALGGGAGVGALAGPIDIGSSPDHGGGHVVDEQRPDPTGLNVSENGYTFVAEDRYADEGEFAFSIIGPDGSPVVDFTEVHERDLHLIVASRSLTEFVHVHPTLVDGRWSVELPNFAPGAYRAFADFQPADDERLTLGLDLTALGSTGEVLTVVPRSSDQVDGYTVDLDTTGEGGEIEAAVTVSKNGVVVTTETYLGAGGHLVALRDGDLAYLHVHPLDGESTSPVRFALEVPSAGTYALFFDFVVDGAVHTARFAIEVPQDDAQPSPTTPPAGHGGGDHE